MIEEIKTANIKIHLKTENIPNRLDIDLKSGKHDAPIPLHLSARFLENAIVRNTYCGNNEWLNEERDENLEENVDRNPLVAGDVIEFVKRKICFFDFKGIFVFLQIYA